MKVLTLLLFSFFKHLPSPRFGESFFVLFLKSVLSKKLKHFGSKALYKVVGETSMPDMLG